MPYRKYDRMGNHDIVEAIRALGQPLPLAFTDAAGQSYSGSLWLEDRKSTRLNSSH